MGSLDPDWCGNVAKFETSNVRANLHAPYGSRCDPPT